MPDIYTVRHRMADFLGHPISEDSEIAFSISEVIDRAEDYRADAEAYRALLADDRHQIQISADGWVIKHPMAERLKGGDRLFECPVTLMASHMPEEHEPGLYYCSVRSDGITSRIEIEEHVS